MPSLGTENTLFPISSETTGYTYSSNDINLIIVYELNLDLPITGVYRSVLVKWYLQDCTWKEVIRKCINFYQFSWQKLHFIHSREKVQVGDHLRNYWSVKRFEHETKKKLKGEIRP